MPKQTSCFTLICQPLFLSSNLNTTCHLALNLNSVTTIFHSQTAKRQLHFGVFGGIREVWTNGFYFRDTGAGSGTMEDGSLGVDNKLPLSYALKLQWHSIQRLLRLGRQSWLHSMLPFSGAIKLQRERNNMAQYLCVWGRIWKLQLKYSGGIRCPL
jgi:hypothetical protein